MKNIDISNVKKIIDATPKEINLMFLGDSGIGKTTVIEEYCKEKGIFLKTLILSQLDASEALGVPTVSPKEFDGKIYKVMEEAIPSWVFELSMHDNAVLFLDEFLCADPSIMNSFLNLLSQKRVGDIDLSHVKFIAASNIGMYTYDPDFNILTRFCFFYVKNSTYKKDYDFIYQYSDPNDLEGVIFEPRRLVPRCAESLRNVPKEYLSYFYEGFTNSQPVVMDFSNGLKNSKEISLLINSFVSYDKELNLYYVDDELLKALCETIYNKYKRSYIQAIDSITVLNDEQKINAKRMDFISNKL